MLFQNVFTIIAIVFIGEFLISGLGLDLSAVSNMSKGSHCLLSLDFNEFIIEPPLNLLFQRLYNLRQKTLEHETMPNVRLNSVVSIETELQSCCTTLNALRPLFDSITSNSTVEPSDKVLKPSETIAE